MRQQCEWHSIDITLTWRFTNVPPEMGNPVKSLMPVSNNGSCIDWTRRHHCTREAEYLQPEQVWLCRQHRELVSILRHQITLGDFIAGMEGEPNSTKYADGSPKERSL